MATASCTDPLSNTWKPLKHPLHKLVISFIKQLWQTHNAKTSLIESRDVQAVSLSNGECV